MPVNIGERRIGAVICDLENTFYPPEEADRIFAVARLKLAKALPAGQDTQTKLKRLLALADKIGWSQAYQQLGGNIDFYHQVVRGIDRSNGLKFNPELHQMLDNLRVKVKLGLLTKATIPTAEAICTKILGEKWQDLFDVVVCDGTPGCPAEKPDPEAFKFILHQLGVVPEHAAMVGDSLADDVLSAAALGLVTVKVGGEKVGPWDLYIARIEELAGHLTIPSQTVNLRK